MSKAFSWFYLSINFGSFFSTLFIPYLLTHYGAKVAFGVPGVLMFLATIVFFLGRKKYKRVPPAGFPKENFLSINFYILKNLKRLIKGANAMQIAREKYSDKAVDAIVSVWKVLGLFAFVPAYWMLSDQSTSEWVIQATKLNLNIFGLTLLPQQVQAANPVMILILTPLFSSFLYPWLEKKGIQFSVHRKILTGFVILISSFIIIYFLQVRIDHGEQPSVLWQIVAYFLLTVAEILVYLTGLEYAYAQAPASMKSTIMSFWLLTISLGNYFVSLINKNITQQGILSTLEGASYDLFFIVIMSVVSIAFLFTFRKTILNPNKLIGLQQK